MKLQPRRYIALALLIFGISIAHAEPFEDIKADLAAAEQVRIDFLSLIESSVFETVDSFPGVAYICSDGRYFMHIGSDEYLFDGEDLYSYSADNNQVTVESMTAGDPTGDQVTFISRLDDYFETTNLSEPGQYLLVRKETSSDVLPDSMTVFLDSKLVRLSQISYYDINEELNRIILDTISYLDKCDSTLYVPAFPDSVETVRLF